MNLLSTRPARPVTTKPAPAYPKQWGVLALTAAAFAACAPTVTMGGGGSAGAGVVVDPPGPEGGVAECFSEGVPCTADADCCNGLTCAVEGLCTTAVPNATGDVALPFVDAGAPPPKACVVLNSDCVSDADCCEGFCSVAGICSLPELAGFTASAFDAGAPAPIPVP